MLGTRCRTPCVVYSGCSVAGSFSSAAERPGSRTLLVAPLPLIADFGWSYSSHKKLLSISPSSRNSPR
ncbi:unnamed protein product [Cochlearia groenlandica]